MIHDFLGIPFLRIYMQFAPPLTKFRHRMVHYPKDNGMESYAFFGLDYPFLCKNRQKLLSKIKDTVVETSDYFNRNSLGFKG